MVLLNSTIVMGTHINTIFGYYCAVSQPNDNHDGTWQIQVLNSRNHPYIPGDIDTIINDNRKNTETVYIWLDANIRIKILSLQEISNPNFIPLEKIVHIEE